MILDVFNDLMKQNFVIGGVVRHITKKGIDKILTIEVKDFIRSNPEAKLESTNIRFDKSTNQYFLTYKITCKDGSKSMSSMAYITRYQMSVCFEKVED